MTTASQTQNEMREGVTEIHQENARWVTALTILIVTYNSRNEIGELLADLEEQPTSDRFEILIIDNASTDGTVDLVRRTCPRARVVRNAFNLGYSRAINQGIEMIDSEYIFLLNPDIRIHDPTILQKLFGVMVISTKIGAVGPLQFMPSEEGVELKFNWSFYTPRGAWLFIQFQRRRQVIYQRPISSLFLNAGCLLLRKSAFEKVGGLDERYFMYGEEPDLFLKFKRYGFEARLHPGASVLHYRERSIKSLPRIDQLRMKVRAMYNILYALNIGSIKITATVFQRFLFE